MYYLCKKYYKPTILYSTVLYSRLCQLGTQVNFVGLLNKLDLAMCFRNRTHSYVGDLVYLSWCVCILTWDKFLSQRNSISNGRTSEPSEVRDYSQANIGRDQTSHQACLDAVHISSRARSTWRSWSWLVLQQVMCKEWRMVRAQVRRGH